MNYGPCPNYTAFPSAAGTDVEYIYYHYYQHYLTDYAAPQLEVRVGSLDEADNSIVTTTIFNVCNQSDGGPDYCLKLQGETLGYCTEEGYLDVEEDMTWTLTNYANEFEVSTSTIITYDPPVLQVPLDLAVGVVWDILSTRTIETDTGATRTDLLAERREAVALEILPDDLLPEINEDLETIRVDSSDGSSVWLAQQFGLVKGPALLISIPWNGQYPSDDGGRAVRP